MRGRGGKERLARLLVRLASSGLAPADRRRFEREWDAEIWQAARGARERGPGPVRMALGAFADARSMNYQRTKQAGVGETMTGFLKDLKIATRGLSRAPVFTVVAIVTLGVGIGGATAITTILNDVVIKPLPYPEPEQLVKVENALPGVGEGTIWQLSTAEYVYIDEELPAFTEVGLYRSYGGNLETPSGPIRAYGYRVTPDLFSVLGAVPVRGRLFTEEEGTPDGPEPMVISEEFWRSAFGSNPAIVGRSVTIYGTPVQIVGVVESGFRVPGADTRHSQIYIPFQIDRGGRFFNSHVNPGVARLAPGQTPESGDAALASMVPRLSERFPEAYGPDWIEGVGFRPHVTPLKDHVVGDIGKNLWVLLGGVGLVLLIAVANVTNLFLVRVEERQGELAVRSALGAGVGTLGRFLAAEALVLTGTGAALALAIAYWGIPAILSIAPESLPRMETIGLGAVGVGTTLALAALTTLVLVAYPLMVHARRTARSGRSTGNRSWSAGVGRQRMRSGLIVAQVAMALVLASGAGLLIESLRSLRSIDPGFDAEGAMTVDVLLEGSTHRSTEATWQAYREILRQVEAIPGVRTAGIASDMPLTGGFACTVQGFEDMDAIGERLRESELTTCAGQTYVSAGFFEASGIPLVAGRYPEILDSDAPSRASIVISEAFAERFFGSEDPLGKGVAPSGRTIGPFYRVVGVVGDIPRETVDGEKAMAIYYPMVPDPDTPGNWGGWSTLGMNLVVKTEAGDPLEVLPAVRNIVSRVDPQATLGPAERLADVLADSMAHITFVSILLYIAAGVALLLAAVGIYGVIAYVVGRRTREFGMRIALGAEPGQIRKGIVGRSTLLAALGLAIGLVLAVVTGRVLEGLLHGVEPGDPLVLAVSAVLLTAIAVIASWVPALRASRVDPIEALRTD